MPGEALPKEASRESKDSAFRSPYRKWISSLSIVAGIGFLLGFFLLISRIHPILMVTVWGFVVLLLPVIIVLCFFDIFYIRWKITSLEEEKRLETFYREVNEKPSESDSGS